MGKVCFTPIMLVKQLDRLSTHYTHLKTCSYKALVTKIKSLGISKLLSLSNNCSLGTVSKALRKSTKQQYNFHLWALVFMLPKLTSYILFVKTRGLFQRSFVHRWGLHQCLSITLFVTKELKHPKNCTMLQYIVVEDHMSLRYIHRKMLVCRDEEWETRI